jgi:hypothetical protein
LAQHLDSFQEIEATMQSTTSDNGKSANKARVPAWRFVIVSFVLLVVSVFLFYRALFPQGYLKSLELDNNLAKWESLHISNYQIKVYLNEATSAHPGPWTIEVRDGKAVSVIDNNGADVDADEEAFSTYAAEYYFTIPGWFRYVKETYEMKPPEVQVEFNPTYGFPDSIYIDPYTEPCCQDFTITVEDFQILP